MNAIPTTSVLIGLVGLAGICAALAVKFGVYRRPVRQYWDTEVPWFVRNLTFGLLPFGAFLLWMLTFPLTRSLGESSTAGTAVALIVLMLLPLVGLLWIRSPPEFLKPEWLKAEERQRLPPARESSSAIDRAFIGCIVAGCIALIVFGGLAIFLAVTP